MKANLKYRNCQVGKQFISTNVDFYFEQDEQDEDKMFLLSMLTEMRKVPPERKT